MTLAQFKRYLEACQEYSLLRVTLNEERGLYRVSYHKNTHDSWRGYTLAWEDNLVLLSTKTWNGGYNTGDVGFNAVYQFEELAEQRVSTQLDMEILLQ